MERDAMTREELAAIRARARTVLGKQVRTDIVALCDALEAALAEVERLKDKEYDLWVRREQGEDL